MLGEAFRAGLQRGPPCPSPVHTGSPGPALVSAPGPWPLLPTRSAAPEGQQPLPHLKRRKSELMFTFPGRDKTEGKLWRGRSLIYIPGSIAPPPAPLTFWEDVHPIPMVELLQNEVHSLLVDTVSCREKASPHQSPLSRACGSLSRGTERSGSSGRPSSSLHGPYRHPPMTVSPKPAQSRLDHFAALDILC